MYWSVGVEPAARFQAGHQRRRFSFSAAKMTSSRQRALILGVGTTPVPVTMDRHRVPTRRVEGWCDLARHHHRQDEPPQLRRVGRPARRRERDVLQGRRSTPTYRRSQNSGTIHPRPVAGRSTSISRRRRAPVVFASMATVFPSAATSNAWHWASGSSRRTGGRSLRDHRPPSQHLDRYGRCGAGTPFQFFPCRLIRRAPARRRVLRRLGGGTAAPAAMGAQLPVPAPELPVSYTVFTLFPLSAWIIGQRRECKTVPGQKRGCPSAPAHRPGIPARLT